jgi:hypothetical protein
MTIAIPWYGKVHTGDYLNAPIITVMLVATLSTFFSLSKLPTQTLDDEMESSKIN